MPVLLHFYRHGVKDKVEGAWFRGLVLGDTQWSKKFLSFTEISRCLNSQEANAKRAAADPAGKWVRSAAAAVKDKLDWQIPTVDFRIALEDRDNRRALKENRDRKRGDREFEHRQKRTMAFCLAFQTAAGDDIMVARFSNGRVHRDLDYGDIIDIGGEALDRCGDRFNPAAAEHEGYFYPVGELRRAMFRILFDAKLTPD